LTGKSLRTTTDFPETISSSVASTESTDEAVAISALTVMKNSPIKVTVNTVAMDTFSNERSMRLIPSWILF
jgi:hypothetical protein